MEAWSRRAQEAGIPHRVLPYAAAAASAGYAALCRTGAAALSLLIPCRTPYAPAGVMRTRDWNAAEEMLALIVKNS